MHGLEHRVRSLYRYEGEGADDLCKFASNSGLADNHILLQPLKRISFLLLILPRLAVIGGMVRCFVTESRVSSRRLTFNP